MDLEMRKSLAELGPDLSSFGTLMTLYEVEGVAQAELSTAVGVQSYSTTRTLDKMEVQGLVERRINPKSRRAYQIYLTDKGRGLRRDLVALVGRVNKQALDCLEPGQRKRLLESLQKVELATRPK